MPFGAMILERKNLDEMQLVFVRNTAYFLRQELNGKAREIY